jgi:hypothetical protein
MTRVEPAGETDMMHILILAFIAVLAFGTHPRSGNFLERSR